MGIGKERRGKGISWSEMMERGMGWPDGNREGAEGKD